VSDDDPARKQREFLAQRQQAYRAVFDGPVGRLVLADLALFCRATASTFHADPRAAAQLDGRREVFLRIQEHIQISDDELWALKQGG
jgi:hypothetical protein